MTREQLGAFARAHRAELAAGGAGAVGLYAYWRRRHATAAVDPNADPSGLSAATNPVDPTAYSSAPYDTYDSIAAQLQSLYDQVNALGAGDPATTPVPAGGSATGIATHGGTNLGSGSSGQLGYRIAPRSPIPRPPVTIPRPGSVLGTVPRR